MLCYYSKQHFQLVFISGSCSVVVEASEYTERGFWLFLSASVPGKYFCSFYSVLGVLEAISISLWDDGIKSINFRPIKSSGLFSKQNNL